MDNRIQIEFIQKANYQKRKEYKHETWFALSNSILENPDYCHFSPVELKALIYVYCQCSKNKWLATSINFFHAEKFHDIPQAVLDAVIKLLEKNQKLTVIGTESGRDQAATERRKKDNKEKKERKREEVTSNEVLEAPSDQPSNTNFSPTNLADLWNNAVKAQGEELQKTLAQVSIKQFKSTSSRWRSAEARLKEQPDPEYWKSVVERIFASDFCMGTNDRGWVAGFDWLIKPEVHIKVSEGNYANRKGKSSKHSAPVGGFQRDHDFNKEFEDFNNEVILGK